MSKKAYRTVKLSGSLNFGDLGAALSRLIELEKNLSEKDKATTHDQTILDRAEELNNEHFLGNADENNKKACIALAYSDVGYYKKALELFDEVIDESKDNLFALERRADTHRLNGDLEKAVLDASAVLSANPNSSFALECRGVAYFENGNYKAALEDLSQALPITSDKYFVLWYMASICIHQKDWQNASDYLSDAFDCTDGPESERAISIKRMLLDVYVEEGNELFDKNELNNALVNFRYALTILEELNSTDLSNKLAYVHLKHGDIYYLDILTMDKALEHLNQVVIIYTDCSFINEELQKIYISALETRADIFRYQHKYTDALSDAKTLLDFNPKSFFALEVCGEIYRLLLKYDEALVSLNAALEENPDSYVALQNRGAVYLKQGKLELAHQDLTKALNINENSSFAHLNLGDVLLQKKQYNFALREFEKVLELSPNSPFALMKRGQVYLKQKNIDAALKDFKTAYENSPGSESEFAKITKDLLGQGEVDTLLKVLEVMLTINPNSRVALEGRGCVYRLKNRLTKALKDLNKAIGDHRDSASAFALENRGAIYYQSQNFDEAYEDFNAAIEKKNGESSFSLTHRGDILNKRGQHEDALVDLEKSINELGDTSVLAYTARAFAYEHTENRTKAVEDYSEVIRQLEKESETITEFSELTEINKKLAFAAMHRGAVYLKLKDFDRAKVDLKLALNTDPTLEFAKQKLEELQKEITSESEKSSTKVSKKSKESIDEDSSSSTESEDDEDEDESQEKESLHSTKKDDKTKKTKDVDDEPSASLTLQMIIALYEQQQKVAEKQRAVAKILYIVGIIIPGLSHLVTYLIVEVALRRNDVVKNPKQKSPDEAYKKWFWEKEWNKLENKGPDGFDRYFYNDKALKQATALNDKSDETNASESTVSEHQEVDSELTTMP